MGLFIQNEVQQSLLNFQLAVVFDQAQLSKFAQENTHPRPGRANERGQRLLVHLYWDRFFTKVIAKIGQQQKCPRQPHLAGTEQLVGQIRFNPGGSNQKVLKEIVGKLLVHMK